MSDLARTLADLRRPRLLVRAARRGLSHYARARDLRSILRADPPAGDASARLLEAEGLLEETRRTGDAAYSAARHICVLTALMAEARRQAPA